MKFDKKNIFILVRELFIIMFVLFIIFSMLEIIKPKIVINYINLDWFLLILIILGFIAVFFSPHKDQKNKKLEFLEHSAIILFSIVIGILFFILTSAIGILALLIAIISIIITYFVIKEAV